MARQRMVKPDLFQHEELHRAETVSALPLRLAYIGLWTQCDRRGCFEWKPATLKLNVLPFDSVDFGAVLSALESHGFVQSYVVEGRRFGYVPTFRRHQHCHKDEKANVLIPDPPAPVPPGASPVSAPFPHGANTPTSASAISYQHTESNTESTSASASARAGAREPLLLTAAEYAIEITRSANRSISDKFGEQPNPLLAGDGRTHALAQDLLDAGIPADFAMRSVARQVLKLEHPVRSMKYFRAGIHDDWARHNERVSAAGSVPVQPLEESKPRRQRSALDIVRDQQARKAAS